MLACFDIGGSLIKAAIAASSSSIGPAASLPTPLHDFAAFTRTIQQLIGDRRSQVDGVAVSITGIIDPATGVSTVANIPCIHQRTLQRDLADALGFPVFIANDADCFVLAEALEGAGRGHRNVFGIILGTGVGGGLVIDGKIVTGAGGFAGEWGHGTSVQTEVGTPPVHFPHFSCGCGQKGCVDSVGGAKGLERIHQTLHDEVLSSFEIIAGWRNRAVKPVRTIEIWTDLVALPLGVVINIVGAGIVPVGGGLSGAPDLIAVLDAAVRSRILYRSPGPIVVPSKLGGNPAFIGAALLGFQELAHG